jgi:electron transport complex protein RnfC
MLMNLFKFKGGVKPPTNKTQSLGRPIAQAPIPSRLVVPLHQSIGGTPRPVVQAGDKVLKGQLIGEADGWICRRPCPDLGHRARSRHARPAAPRASTRCAWSSNRTARMDRPRAFDYTGADAGTGARAPAAGRRRRPRRRSVPDPRQADASKTVPMEEMVINGAECEPFITCDDLLMRERAEEVVRGIGIFRDLLQPKRVLIGIEDNKPEAAAAARRSAGGGRDVRSRPGADAVPAGGAKQLIRVLTGKEVPAASARPTSACSASTSPPPTPPGAPSPTANRSSRAW